MQHTSSSKTSARKTQLAKQDRGRKRPLRKTRCRKFPDKLVLNCFPILLTDLKIILRWQLENTASHTLIHKKCRNWRL